VRQPLLFLSAIILPTKTFKKNNRIKKPNHLGQIEICCFKKPSDNKAEEFQIQNTSCYRTKPDSAHLPEEIKKRDYLRIFVLVIFAGAVFSNGNGAPTDGLISMFILVVADIGDTKKLISTCSLEFNAVTALPPSLVVNTVVFAVAPCVRVIGVVSGVEKTILRVDKSIADAPGARLMGNVILVMVELSVESPKI
jgi:hypothetical protein